MDINRKKPIILLDDEVVMVANLTDAGYAKKRDELFKGGKNCSFLFEDVSTDISRYLIYT